MKMIKREDTEIVIIGAGFGGICAALELEKLELPITLLEMGEEIFSRTSINNPGKLHLGFHYPLDTSLETAKEMLLGAFAFMKKFPNMLCSSPEQLLHSYYFITTESLLSSMDFLKFLEKLKRLYKDYLRKNPKDEDYFGEIDEFYKILPPSEYQNYVNTKKILLGISTIEPNINIQKLKKYVTKKILSSSFITLQTNHKVIKIENEDFGYLLTIETKDKSIKKIFSRYVINAAWEHRIELDSQIGNEKFELTTDRLKFIATVQLPKFLLSTPTSGFCIGPFAMFHNLGNSTAMITYAPVSTYQIISDMKKVPVNWEKIITHGLSKNEEKSIGNHIIEGVAQYMPGILQSKLIKVSAGVVHSKGDANIFQKESSLHKRVSTGPLKIRKGYYTFDTGKFSLAVYHAKNLANTIRSEIFNDKKIQNITIYGAGYVGLVTGFSLANQGHNVLMVDINQERVDSLNRGELPIYEKGLAELFRKLMPTNKLKFTSDIVKSAQHSLLQFVAVGTPNKSTGEVEMSHLMNVVENIASNVVENSIIVIRSTVPIGTNDKINKLVQCILTKRKLNITIDILSNPEFLMGGKAIFSFNHPDRIIIGSRNPEASNLLLILYRSFVDDAKKILIVDPLIAELSKYAANAFLAMRISFINEIAELADKFNSDISEIKKCVGLDHRIGVKFFNPGCGYGGSCFPKDVSALINMANENQVTPYILNAIQNRNNLQKQTMLHKLLACFHQRLANKTIALWGLAFKPETNDIREAIGVFLMNKLLKKKVIVKVYDPMAMPEAKKHYSHEQLVYCESALDALMDSDALLITTEWSEFINFDLSLIRKYLRYPIVIDGRNIFNPKSVWDQGIYYFSIGRSKYDRVSLDKAISDYKNRKIKHSAK